MISQQRAMRHYAAVFGDGRAGASRAIGDILRQARRAAEINMARGPGDDVAGCMQDIRAAADRALRVCECAGGQT